LMSCVPFPASSVGSGSVPPDSPMPVRRATPPRFALREVCLDLLGGSSRRIRLVLPQDWRDVPHRARAPPFWALPWPCGTATSRLLLERPELVAGKQVCDLGCGVGAAGLAAGLAGAEHVAFADHNAHALHCAWAGAEANGLGDRCSTLALDWSDELHATDSSEGPTRFDVVLACDVCYSLSTEDTAGSASFAAVTRTMRALLRPGGHLLVAMPIESESRPQATHEEAHRCFEALTCPDGGFVAERVSELAGAQLPGEGPEGLATSRRVLLGSLRLH